VNEVTMLTIAREVQIPLLAVLLIGGCAAKAHRAAATRWDGAEAGPTAMLPPLLRRPVALALCATELALGVGLLATAGLAGPRSRSASPRPCCSARRRARCMSCGRAGRTPAAAASASSAVPR
jgi:hypothetical protein